MQKWEINKKHGMKSSYRAFFRQKSNKKLNKERKEKEVQALGQLVSVS